MSSPASPGAAPSVGMNIVTTTAFCPDGAVIMVRLGLAKAVLPPWVVIGR